MCLLIIFLPNCLPETRGMVLPISEVYILVDWFLPATTTTLFYCPGFSQNTRKDIRIRMRFLQNTAAYVGVSDSVPLAQKDGPEVFLSLFPSSNTGLHGYHVPYWVQVNLRRGGSCIGSTASTPYSVWQTPVGGRHQLRCRPGFQSLAGPLMHSYP